MIDRLKPYPDYKDSGVPWLGEVPEHWEVRRLKRIARLNPSKSEVPLAMRNDSAVFLPMERVGSDGRFDASEVRSISALWNGFTYFRRGDVIVAKITPCFENGKGACLQNLPTSVGFGSTEFHVMRPSGAVTAPYLYRITTLSEFRRLGADEMTGAAGQQRVPAEFIANFLIPLPPLPEQTAIVRLLDYTDRRVRRSIRAKQKRIKLLEEYRQALIHQAVTGQIDVRTGKRYPAYKDSGVEWLGQVPEHWEVRRLKRIARLNPSKSEIPLAMRNDPAVFLPMERVGLDGQIDASEVRSISALWNGFTYFRRGDVIVAKITPCFENGKGACLQNLPTSVGFGSTEFHVIRPSGAVTVPYLYRITTLSEFRRLGADEMTGAAGQQRVPAEFIANFLIPLPPLPEQTAIAEYLDAQTAKIDAAIAAARRAIELLREYRERLIADVVTGKLDVREVAECLPEEAEEPELLQEEVELLSGESEETSEALSADEESEG
ncbi:type I restriction-modification enzyme, S subunit [Hydrogenophilus thermoluteolus]|uniref:restriction endonuclease subunit S n=1 Tax=Hydrogenophilus thermoluteolus TaxID=297 RepID=UPI0024A26C1B|nr:restriction endonuclease subunit S [Hydrogenophilus thermoluteolus]GLW60309.1 type I restriction-modification enzyme, S subunit [Hydrogenophilus thermoluteolus]